MTREREGQVADAPGAVAGLDCNSLDLLDAGVVIAEVERHFLGIERAKVSILPEF